MGGYLSEETLTLKGDHYNALGEKLTRILPKTISNGVHLFTSSQKWSQIGLQIAFYFLLRQ